MDMCLLCLELRKDSENEIKFESTQWQEWKIEEIIEKHIWPLKSLTSNSWLCFTCWQVLKDFHEFYKRIEDAHEFLTSSMLKTEMQEIPEDDDKYVNINERNVESLVHEDTEHLMEEAIDQFLDNIISNEKEKQTLNFKLETSKAEMVEEVTVPLKRSCRLRGEDPLEKSISTKRTRKAIKNKVSCKRKQREVKKNKTKTKPKTKTKTKDKCKDTSLEQVAAEAYNTDSETDNERNKDDSLHSDDLKTSSLNCNYKPSAEHKEQDKFVAENFRIICGICQVPMQTFYDVSAHSAKEHNKHGFVKCCNKKFYRRINLVEHIRWHLDPERFKCKECGKVLADRRCLQVHVRLHEQRDRNHICDICGKGFARPVTLQRHKYTHIPDEERNIPCEQCDKKFANNDLLMEHVRSVHLHSYSVVCDICGKEIRSKAVFKRHMLQHAGLQTTVSCDICGLKLSDKRRLKVHKQTQHSQEASKEYKCHICSKMSASRGALKQHIQYNHETGYDFKCTVCDKAFKRASTLKEHMATHTGTVLYTCPYCPKTFNSNANMYTHRKKAHPQKWEEAFREKYSGNLPPKLHKPAIEGIAQEQSHHDDDGTSFLLN